MDRLPSDVITHIGSFLNDDHLALMNCSNASKIFKTIANAISYKKIVFLKRIVDLDKTITAIKTKMPNLRHLCMKLIAFNSDFDDVDTDVFHNASFDLKIKLDKCTHIDIILHKLRMLPVSSLHIHLRRSHNYRPITNTHVIDKLKLYGRHTSILKEMGDVIIRKLVIDMECIDSQGHPTIDIHDTNIDEIHMIIDSFYFVCNNLDKMTSITMSSRILYPDGPFYDCLVDYPQSKLNIKDVYINQFCPQKFTKHNNPALMIMSILPRDRVTYHVLLSNDSYIIPFLKHAKKQGIKSRFIKFLIMSDAQYKEARLLQMMHPNEEYGITPYGDYQLPSYESYKTLLDVYRRMSPLQKDVYFWLSSSHMTLPRDSQAV